MRYKENPLVLVLVSEIMKHVSLFLALIFVCGYAIAEKCMTCDSSKDSFDICKYGGEFVVDADECPKGKSTCYRLKYSLNGGAVYKRGCDGPNFCNEQWQKGDIRVLRCDQCSGYYCNIGSLAY
ncbi:hypothetical protein WA026_001820 [Henosepilachna vigintioctopunctata]|uniref:Uncharacterized protein n=1 Tax=Henosepilachna vigintioctopunctata TaxID=420089 RepID=A0AAW1URF9_9CUCU